MIEGQNQVFPTHHYQTQSLWTLNLQDNVENHFLYLKTVDVQIEYPDNSMRPSRYVVNTIVDGKLIGTRFFDNYGGGAQ